MSIRNAAMTIGESTSAHTEMPSTSKGPEEAAQKLSTANIVKGTIGAGSFLGLAAALRSAWKYSRIEEAKALKHAEVLSGVGFATKALVVATAITVSGFTLALVGISWALNVNTPKQFGKTVKDFFGDSLRLEGSKTPLSPDDFEKMLTTSNFSINKKKEPEADR